VIRRALQAALIALAVSCGPPAGPASAVCMTNADCQAGLMCLPLGISTNGVCSASQSKQCTVACTTDADCASLKGPNGQGGFTCLQCPPVQATCGLIAH
jgi:hypothetical protein